MKNILSIIAMITTLTTFSQVPNYVPTNGLVGWWPFNGNANDESGNGNNGIVNGATLSADRFGNASSTYDFDGVNDYIEIQHSSGLDLANEFTVQTWFYSSQIVGSINSSSGSNLIPLVSKWFTSGNPNNSFLLSIQGDLLVGTFASAGSSSMGIHTTANTNSLLENQWCLISFVKDSLSIRIYVNGLEVSSDSISSSNVYNSSNNLFFGNWLYHYNNAYSTFNGKLDDIGIWNRALSECEIKDLYNAQLNSVAVSAGNDLTVCTGEEILLSGTGADSYTWSNGVLDSIPFTATTTSEYVVVGIDTLGCIGSDTVQVNVLPTSSSFQNETSIDSYVWPVNGQTYTQSGTYTDTLINTQGCDSIVTLNLDLNFTGLEKPNAVNGVEVYPNPVSSTLTIESQKPLNTSYRLFDALGREVLEGKLSGTQAVLDIENLSKGSYTLIFNQNTIKIIKK